ncbi:unnamed protein product [Urochloa decumbens]|uniref:Uncharacterized protein n=1 Tax=Urochloa decumbens TaxID=240449 RepID=A0ABC8VT54_9POAL
MDLATTPARRPMEAGLARRLWHVVLAVCHMVRRGLSRKRIMMDVHLLLGRGKLAGRALRGLLAHPAGHGHLTSYGGGASSRASSSSSLASFYGHPREVEFSCTTTPAAYAHHYGLFPFNKGGRGGRGARGEYGGLDAAAVARAFEMLSAEVEGTPASVSVGGGLATATPSPMVAWILGRSPAGVRPLRVTDSPFPAVPEDGCCNDRVDAEADDFIRKFYEQLRLQPSAATPDYAGAHRLHRRG